MRKIKITYKKLTMGFVVDTIEGWLYLNKKWQVDKLELPKHQHPFSSLYLFTEAYIADVVKELISYPNGRTQISEGITFYWTAIIDFPYVQSYNTVMTLEAVDWEIGYWNLINEIYYFAKDAVNNMESKRRLYYLLDVLDNTFFLEERPLNAPLLDEIKALGHGNNGIPYEDRMDFVAAVNQIVDNHINIV